MTLKISSPAKLTPYFVGKKATSARQNCVSSYQISCKMGGKGKAGTHSIRQTAGCWHCACSKSSKNSGAKSAPLTHATVRITGCWQAVANSAGSRVLIYKPKIARAWASGMPLASILSRAFCKPSCRPSSLPFSSPLCSPLISAMASWVSSSRRARFALGHALGFRCQRSRL